MKLIGFNLKNDIRYSLQFTFDFDIKIIVTGEKRNITRVCLEGRNKKKKKATDNIQMHAL